MSKEIEFDPLAFVQAIQEQTRIYDIKVCGVRLGDKFEDLTSVSLTEQELRQGSWMRVQSGIRFYGGELEGVKRIKGIFIAAQYLKPLNTPILETVQDHCGPAYFVEQRMGQTYYHYPDHRTILSPISNNVNLIGVHIGEAGPTLPQYSAYSLLEAFVEILLPLGNYKREFELKAEPGSLEYYYHQRLIAFLRAFEIGEEINSDFVDCEFIAARSSEEVGVIEAFLINLIKEMEDQDFAQRLNSMRGRFPSADPRFNIRIIYNSLLSFYIKYKRFLGGTAIGLEGPSYPLDFAFYYTHQVYSSINKEAVEQIRAILAFIIDPKKRSFDKKEMIEQFGYPNVDIEWMKNQEYDW